MKLISGKWLRVLRYIVLGYLLVCALFYAFQERIFFHPEPLDAGHTYVFANKYPVATATLPFDEHTKIELVKFLPADSTLPRRGVVLFFHGNRRNVEHYSRYAPFFTRHGYEVWMPDYPGFGKSTGVMNQQLLYDIAMQVYKMARVGFDKDEIVVYGKSLGTGLAAHLASKADCRALLLETPYYNFTDLIRRYGWMFPVQWLSRYDFRTDVFLPEVTAPVTIVAAGNDGLIPPSHTARLKGFLKPGDQYYLVPGAAHDGLAKKPQYGTIIDSVLRQ